MIKKILIGALFAGLIGVLVWGSVNRTLAKSGDNYKGNQWKNDLEFNASNNSTGRGRWNQGDTQAEKFEFERGGRSRLAAEEKANNVETEFGYNNIDPYESMDQNELNQGYRGGQEDITTEVGNSRGRGNGRWGNGTGQGAARDPLDETDIEALQMALEDEYHALATYLSVIETFGEVDPFVNIARSEQRHINALVNQFNKYGIPVPENSWTGTVPIFDSLTQACQTGVDAETANIALYEKLFTMTDNAALIRVFTNLSRASLEQHLPEFEACK